MQEAELAVSSLRGRVCGTLRLNAPASFGNLHLAPALPALTAAHPDLVVELALTDRFVDLMEEGFDAVLRITARPPPGAVARRVAGMRTVLCAAPAYLDRHGAPAVPADLARHNCLLYGPTRPVTEWRLLGPGEGEARSVVVGGSLRANNGDALHIAALAGLGVAFLPTFIVGPDLASGALRRVLPGVEGAPSGLFLLAPPTAHETPKVSALGDFLFRQFGPAPWEAGLAPAAPAS